MDPIILAATAAGISESVPALGRMLKKWIAPMTLDVVAKNGSTQVVGLTQENVKALLDQLLKKPELSGGHDDGRASGETTTNEGTKISGEIGGTAAGRDIDIRVNGDGIGVRMSETRPKDFAVGRIVAAPTTEYPDPEALKISLAQATLVRMHARLGVELPRARSRNRLAKRVRLSSSLVALASNVGVLGALGLGNATASIIAAVIALLVAGLKTVEDYLITGVTGKDPQRLQELVIETNRLWYEAGEVLDTFNRLAAARAKPDTYPLADAERVAKELMRLLPEMELTGD